MIGATLVLLVGWCVIPRLRQRSAGERHLFWAVSLGVAALIPVLGLLLPAWRPEWAAQVGAALPSALGGSAPVAGSDGADIVVRATGLEPAGWAMAGLWLWVWIGGALVTAVKLTAEALALARFASQATPLFDRRLRQLTDAAAQALQIGRPIRLVQSGQGAVPITWGGRRPSIALPVSATTWPDDRAAAVIAHELAHVRRHDWIVHVAAEVGCSVYWFHPLFWIARGQLWAESERAADDLVLALGVEGDEYASHLLAIVRAALPHRVWSPAVAMARPSRLEGRFAALLSAGTNRRAATRRTVLAVAATALLLALPLATISLHGGPMRIEIKTANLPDILDPGAVSDRGSDAPPVRGVRVADVDTAGVRAVPPEIVEYTTPPLYSDEARRRGIEGLVTVAARVDADGRVSAARVVRGLGSGLDQNALVALRQWRFRPGTRAGAPIALWAEVDIEFSLRNEAMNALVANDMATRVGPGVTPPQAIRVFGLWKRHPAKQGKVVLDVVLLENGTPKVVRILQSLDPELDENAVWNFSHWRFSPAMKNGRAVKVRLNAEVNFHG